MLTATNLNDANAVWLAVEEFDQIGRVAFLGKYSFGKAEKYFLKIGEKHYDSKAIVGAALKYQYPSEEVAKFSGGIASGQAAYVLKSLNFVISDGAPKLLVLIENIVNANPKFIWNDVTGERYHFPNQYRKKIVPGTKFIYYRGALRKNGKRTTPEYFGTAIIGDVYLDESTSQLPANNKKWYADIVDFKEFEVIVPFRDSEGIYPELGSKDLPKLNYWRNTSRVIEKECFDNICQSGGVLLGKQDKLKTSQKNKKIPTIVYDGLVIENKAQKSLNSSNESIRNSYRRISGRAKEIGDLAEAIFCDWLRAQTTTVSEQEKIVWVASQGLTPGYDVEDQRNPLLILGYEVKATTGKLFKFVEFTENEFRKAREMRERYFLVLVAEVESDNPKIRLIQDPATLIEQGKLLATPSTFRLEFL